MNRKKILIVEDNKGIREGIAMLLNLEQIDSICAADGQEALKLLKNNATLDLILLDLRMPVMGGIEFLKEFKTDPAHQKIPVVLLSAANDNMDLEDLPISAVIRKPFEADTLLSTIRKLMS